ncbi:uncharacterized protein MELLADRAFT_91297 [Melampsora larici-populina 98AG31]|uniref:Uncharacterized protein n=1 Tax=Melampsora larici-populina (strain 98AG31 / pathotype 3-4-7) TaxID=747676 RepID=F4RYI9_MELLP|nr:uncharacterized protein MELLADRAFT_91297 [Melampsora larici-populina 98AG31]EGG02480.1 hypothetical protein MELLADRAFT_91297 [Melampsora larici-populina 98AG31]
MPPKPRASRKLPSSNRITRKQATNSRPEDNTDEPAVVALSKKRKNRPVEPDEGSEEALEEIDVSGKRSRTRLLELLDNHITKKKARHSKKKTAKKRPRSGVVENKDVTVRSPEVTSDTIPSTEVNYNKFDKHELVEILRDVGIDASGMEKDRLVETCGFYKDLIVLPTSLVQQEPKVPIQSTSQIRGKQASFTFEVTSKEVDKDLQTGSKNLSESSVPGGSTGDIIVDEPSDTFIPSLEHGRLRYPRPQPTSLEQLLPSTSNKGKEREQVHSDSEYVPEDDKMSDTEGTGTNRNQESKEKGGVPPDVNSDGETRNKESGLRLCVTAKNEISDQFNLKQLLERDSQKNPVQSHGGK